MDQNQNRRLKVSQDTICLFINSGQLEEIILKNGYVCDHTIKFVSLDNSFKLTILLCGTCGSCKATHIRNTCNYRFNKECVKPALLQKFKFLADVVPLNTHDPQFTQIVEGIGGTIYETVSSDTMKVMFDHENFLLCFHPDVESYAKFMRSRHNQGPKPQYEP